jgi:hypothetical protein
MRHWHAAKIDADAPMIGPDGLHMTDRGYGCLAAGLADALAVNWRDARRALTAAVSGAAARPAGLAKARRALRGHPPAAARSRKSAATKGRVNRMGSILAGACSGQAEGIISGLCRIPDAQK